jgi:hypothetical protein
MAIANDKKTALALHMQYPKDYISFSRGFTSSHRGVDMAWNSNYGGQNVPIYAPADGEVVSVVNTKGNTWAKGVADWGNLVKIKHAANVYTLSAHMLKGSIVVKVGQKVKRGDYLGKQNNSGYSNGSHDHFEVYVGGAGTKFRVNPVDYCFAYPHQIVNADTQKTYNIQHYSPIAYVGTPVARNSKVNQLNIKSDTLRARKTPSTSGTVLGYANKGIYNVTDSKTADGYTWYNVGEFWVANNSASTWCEYLPKAEPKFNLTMNNLTKAQADAMVAWCVSEKVNYDLKEI